jgi:hypothetical protein
LADLVRRNFLRAGELFALNQKATGFQADLRVNSEAKKLGE